ncbi:MAG: hypothetical protein EAX81_05555 [Candidatus Thorarchaeota archaeon]|nr:hypothetical protein [Candidatus Thorarchaeota archaeon]
MDFSALRDEMTRNPWERTESEERPLQPVNLAPLKGVIETDAVRSKVLRVLIEDGTWVTTADLLKEARKERPILGAVSIGTILNGLNNLVASRLILSRTSSAAGTDWAEWRINPDLLKPTRKLLQMLTRPKFEKMLLSKNQSEEIGEVRE